MWNKFKEWFNANAGIICPLIIVFIMISGMLILASNHDCYSTKYEIIDKIQYDETYGTRNKTSTKHCYKFILKDRQNYITEKDVDVETWYNFEIGNNIIFGCKICGKLDRNNVR